MAKTIFKTSEKSNFILNMTKEQYSNIASKALFAMCLLISLFTIPAECSNDVGFSIVSAGLAISGVICMILALIAVIKKYVSRKMIFPVAAFGIMLVWGAISLADSYSVSIGFYGFTGRGEGLLALIFYLGFFITALTISGEKAVGTLLNGIISVGILNSVWGLLQVFVPVMPSNYRHVLGIKEDINAASGLAQSPIFLAMLLSLSLTAAVIGFIMSNSKKKRMICFVCGCIFSFTIMFTYSLVGIVGIVFSLIAAIAAVLLSGAPKTRLAAAGGVIISAALAVILAVTGIAGNNNKYALYDGSTIWRDSYNRLSSSGLYNKSVLDIESTSDVYYYLNSKTMNIIEDYPLTGTGPDQLVYPQLYASSVIDENPGTFDKVYNEYLYTAATRGVISLLALIAVLASLIAISAKRLKALKKSPAAVSCFFLLLCGVALFFVGCSNIGFSPIFWAAAGASCAELKKAQASSEKKSKK